MSDYRDLYEAADREAEDALIRCAQLRRERDTARAERDRAIAERDAALGELHAPAAGREPVIRVVTWDLRGRPDPAELARAVWEASHGRAVLRELVTAAVEVAIVLADRPVTDEEALAALET